MRLRVFLWHGYMLFLAEGLNVPPHRHVAHQLSVGLDGPFRHLTADDQVLEGPGFIAPTMTAHGFDSASSRQYGLWVEPYSLEGRYAKEKFAAGQITVFEDELAEKARRALEGIELDFDRGGQEEALQVRRILADVLLGKHHEIEEIDPRVRDAVDHYFEHRASDVTVGEVAEHVGLSESYFSRLFSSQMGVPPSRYRLWMRVQEATRRLSEGTSITEAAHEAGFADAAHYTRTYRKLMGATPSKTWFESDFVEAVICDPAWR